MDVPEDLKRTVKGALITPSPGVVSIHELLHMPEVSWRELRNRISDGYHGGNNGRDAKCLWCGGTVYIQERAKGAERFPLFAHRSGEGIGCPWHPQSTLSPDDARAAQYQGNQKSIAHEFICSELARLLRLDKSLEHVEVDKTYVAGEPGQHGRFPDVRFKMTDLPECVLEVQLSNTFQPEISQRGLFYQSHGMPLVWVLHGVDARLDNLPSSFRDVIHRHKNNAFSLDQEAVAESERQNTLVLRCHMLDRTGKVAEVRLVPFRDLKRPRHGLPFWRNMLVPDPEGLKRVREPWYIALKEIKAATHGNWHAEDLSSQAWVSEAFKRLPVPATEDYSPYDFARLVAITFTLLSEANGKFRDLVYNHMPNATAAFNTFLHRSSPQQACAIVLETLIERTTLKGSLKPTVRKHIGLAKEAWPNQIDHEHAFYGALRVLVPEVFDDEVREEMMLEGLLPDWAMPHAA